MDTEGSFPCSHQSVTGPVSAVDAFCTSCSVFQVSSAVLRALKPSGHYMYRQFNIQQFYVLPIECIYMCFVWI